MFSRVSVANPAAETTPFLGKRDLADTLRRFLPFSRELDCPSSTNNGVFIVVAMQRVRISTQDRVDSTTASTRAPGSLDGFRRGALPRNSVLLHRRFGL